MEMSSPVDLIQDNGNRFKKRKARFTFSEVHILLDEVRKYRHIIVGKFNRGVPTEVKKLKWAQITARVNEIGECQREVIEIIKKWSDLKCDTKRKVAAMRTGATPHRGLNSRMSRDLTQIEQIVHQILEMDDDAPPSSGEFGPVEEDDDDDRHEEDDVLEGEDMARYHDSSPNGGLETLSMSMPPPFPKEDSSLPTYSGSSRESSQHFFETQYEIPANEETEVAFMDSDDDQRGDRGPSARTIRPPEDHRANNGILRASPSSSSSAAASSSSFRPAHHPAPVPPFSAGPPPPPAPEGGPEGGPWAREALLRDASLSLREQHATNLLLETVSRSLELLSESVQQLAETQQEFVRESLHLQRETVQVLRDFTGGAIALMHDKLNGRPAL